MTKKYNQLTLEQRYKIECYFQAGKLQSEIAKLIGVHKSTICRELKRNTPKRGPGAKIYNAKNADTKTTCRHKQKRKCLRLTAKLKSKIKKMMMVDRLSPELIAAIWKREGIEGVSYETIYKFIWASKHENKRINYEFKALYKYLKHGKRRRKRGNYKDSRGLIPNRVSIEKRPKIVEKRKRYGDIEVDLIMGAHHKSALLVTIDRASLYATIDKLKGKDSNQVKKTIIKRMKKFPQIKTMTFDNDQAFSMHEEIAKELSLDTYFTKPYTSQDKGTIENRNGIIRIFYPKKTDFNTISKAQIKKVERKINNRPVRKFNYLTPNEVFLKLKGSVALIG